MDEKSEIEKKLLAAAFDENGYRHPLTSLLLGAADEIRRLRWKYRNRATDKEYGTMIPREELDRIGRMAADYIKSPAPRTGHETIALYDRLHDAVMENLAGILEAADVGISSGYEKAQTGAPWRSALYADGKTPDRKAIDDAASEQCAKISPVAED